MTTGQPPQWRSNRINFTDVVETGSLEVLTVHAVNHTVNGVREEHAPHKRLQTRLTANKRTSFPNRHECNVQHPKKERLAAMREN